MRYKDWDDLLRKELAAKHKELKGFAMVITGGGLIANLDIREFLKTKHEMESPFMLGESYDWRFLDNTSDNKRKEITGAFWILHKVEPDDFKARTDVLDLCERIAENCMAKLRSIYLDRKKTTQNTWLNLEFDCEFTPLVDNNYYGCRVQVVIITPANQQMVYDETFWE
jgi:hypothetical protein